jgi:hypothetical protein
MGSRVGHGSSNTIGRVGTLRAKEKESRVLVQVERPELEKRPLRVAFGEFARKQR